MSRPGENTGRRVADTDQLQVTTVIELCNLITLTTIKANLCYYSDWGQEPLVEM